MKIGILGHPGQLSSSLQATLPDKSELEAQFFTRSEWDITDIQQSNRMIRDGSFSTIINTAAYTQVDRAEEAQEEAYKVNAKAVESLGMICAQKNVSLIHISSDYVYHPDHLFPIDELSTAAPKSAYAKSKWEGDKNLLNLDVKGCILRTSWVYSPYGHNFVKTMIRLMESKPELRVVSDQWGTPTSSLCLAELIWSILFRSELTEQAMQVFNYTQKGVTNWYEFAKQIKLELGSTTRITPIHSRDYPTPASRPRNSILNCEKLDRLDLQNRKTWKEALSETLELLKTAT